MNIFSFGYIFLLANTYVNAATLAPQLDLLQDVPSATELRKTVTHPKPGDACGYGEFGGGQWLRECPEGWIIPEWYINDLSVRCCIKTKCGNSQGYCTNAGSGGCVGQFQRDTDCPGYRLNIECCIPVKLTFNAPAHVGSGKLSQTYIEEGDDNIEALSSSI